MYRSGTDLAASVDAGATQIEVVDPTGFAVNDTIIIFDAGPIGGGPRSEEAQIASINGDLITLAAPLQNAYKANYPQAYEWDNPDKRGAAIVEAGTPVFDPLSEPGMLRAFGRIATHWRCADGGAFIDVRRLDSGSGMVPYRQSFGTRNELNCFGHVWFSHGVGPNKGVDNCAWLLGCNLASPSLLGHEQALGNCDTLLHRAIVCVGEIGVRGYNQNAVSACSAHEVGHLFVPYEQTDTGHGTDRTHCGLDYCLMGYYSNLNDEVMEFCTGCLSSARRAPDPF